MLLIRFPFFLYMYAFLFRNGSEENQFKAYNTPPPPQQQKPKSGLSIPRLLTANHLVCWHSMLTRLSLC